MHHKIHFCYRYICYKMQRVSYVRQSLPIASFTCAREIATSSITQESRKIVSLEVEQRATEAMTGDLPRRVALCARKFAIIEIYI